MKHLERRARRGVAFILALVAVAAATLLGVTVASTRDASSASNDAVARNAAARAAAAGGLDLVERLVEDTNLFAANDADGDLIPLFETVNIGGVMLRAEIQDLETGGPVTAATRAFVTVTEATVGNITQVARSVSQLTQADIVARADLDLSEFAVLATRASDNVRIRAKTADGVSSTLAVWQSAPTTSLSEPFVMGTFDRRAEHVAIDSGSTALGHTLLDAGDFADSNEALDTDLAIGVTRLPHDIHVIPVASPPKSATVTSPTRDLFVQHLGNGPRNLVTDAEIAFGGGDSAEIAALDTGPDEWRQFDIHASLKLISSTLRVTVPTVMVVREDLLMTNGSIEVDEGASLLLIVQGSVQLAGSYIGAQRAFGETLDASGHASYPVAGAGSVAILAATPDGPAGSISIMDGSVIKGRLYMPSREILLSDQSAVYGSVVGETVELLGASIFYDPALRNDRGWLNPRSGIYQADGAVRAEVRAIGALNDAAFADFADATGVAPDLLLGVIMPNALAAGAGGGGSGDDVGGGGEGAGMGGGKGGGELEGPEAPAGGLVLTGTLRKIAEDGSADGSPDFGSSDIGVDHYIGTVEDTLGGDGKPVHRGWMVGGKWQTLKNNFPFKDSQGRHISPQLYRPALGDTAGVYQGISNKPSVTSAASLATWFTDGPSTKASKPFDLVFEANGNDTYTAYLFVDPSGNEFTPALDGFVPYFTYEASASFTYQDHDDAGYTPWMVVKADDDLWIYVDGKLVSDISGIQNQEVEQHIDLTRLGLSNGVNYEIKLFYAARKHNGSVLRMETNVMLRPPGEDDDCGDATEDEQIKGNTPLVSLREAIESVRQRLESGEFDPEAARYGTITPRMRRNFGAVAMNDAPTTPD